MPWQFYYCVNFFICVSFFALFIFNSKCFACECSFVVYMLLVVWVLRNKQMFILPIAHLLSNSVLCNHYLKCFCLCGMTLSEHDFFIFRITLIALLCKLQSHSSLA